MKRQFVSCLLIFLIILFTTTCAFADGDPNIDGGGGGTEDGDISGGNYWSVGNDGIRVTIVEEKTKKGVRTPVDFSNKSLMVDFFFGFKSKLTYKTSSLAPQMGSAYKAVIPKNALPTIVSASGGANIEAVKRYFADASTLKFMAEQVSFPYDRLIGGDYVLLLEPIIYVTFNGQMYAMTATEAALFDQIKDGGLKSKLGYATHQNLPLAMFLEKPDLGYPAWGGSRTGIRTNNEIISSLGLGTVRFRDAPPEEEVPSGRRYEYRTDTDVITAVTVSNYGDKDINPDDDARVVFDIDGTRYSKPFVTPPNEETLIWVKWHTPSTPQTITVSVSSTHGSLDATSIACDIVTLEENTPPDPKPKDKPPFGYHVPPRPLAEGKTSMSWGEWLPWWKENWQWVSDMQWSDGSHDSSCSAGCTYEHGEWVDNGKYEDLGNWEYDWESYSASLSITPKISPAAEVPTAKLLSTGVWDMKSGYGINFDVATTVSTTGKSGDVTPAQNAVTFFPEFDYLDYFRVLVLNRSGLRSSFSFAYNKYSFVGASVHYTPIWYPDRSDYAPKVTVFDVWTPAGQMYYTKSDYLTINGDCDDDWNVAPVRGGG